MLDPRRAYVLVLADLKDSTVLAAKPKAAVFARLDDLLRRWNRRRKNKPALPLSLAYGDEVAGLFDDFQTAGELVAELREAVAPEGGFRFAVVRGHVGRASDDVRQVGGEIFKIAAQAVDALKRSGGYGAWRLGGDALVDETLDALTLLVGAQLDGMTNWQRDVYRELALGKSQTDIAVERDRTPQAISEAARRGGAARVIAADAVARSWLCRLDAGDFGPADLAS